jgi:hypothetical protein
MSAACPMALAVLRPSQRVPDRHEVRVLDLLAGSARGNPLVGQHLNALDQRFIP